MAPLHRFSPRIRTLLNAFGPPLLVIGSFTWFVATYGLPRSRTLLLCWAVFSVVVLLRASPRKLASTGFVRQFLPFSALLLAYDIVRGQADRLFDAHLEPQAMVDRFIGFGEVPTVRLQQWLHEAGRIHWYDAAALVVYLSHFVVPFAVAVTLFVYRNSAFGRYVRAFVVLTVMALATYALKPAVPPWMASEQGHIGDVTRIVPQIIDTFGVSGLAFAWETGEAYANPVAALPSLHAAYPALLCVLLLGRSRVLAVAAGCYAIAMGLTLVYTGEHYVFDVLLGWTYAAVAVFAADAIAARRARRRVEAVDQPDSAGPLELERVEPVEDLETAA